MQRKIDKRTNGFMADHAAVQLASFVSLSAEYVTK
jgi:hypothetical protein